MKKLQSSIFEYFFPEKSIKVKIRSTGSVWQLDIYDNCVLLLSGVFSSYIFAEKKAACVLSDNPIMAMCQGVKNERYWKVEK